MENLEISSCRTGDSAGYDRVWAQIDMDAVLFNMESMRANIREDVKIVAIFVPSTVWLFPSPSLYVTFVSTAV